VFVELKRTEGVIDGKLMANCLVATMRKGKLYIRSKKSKKCKKQRNDAQSILDSVKTMRIIYK